MSKMISLTEDGAFLASDNITAVEYINMTLSAQFNLFNNLAAQGQPKEELYDLYNAAASAFLSTFIPDRELRPDLTEEAILQMENQILDTAVPVIQDATKNLAAEIKEQMILDGLVPAQPTPTLNLSLRSR